MTTTATSRRTRPAPALPPLKEGEIQVDATFAGLVRQLADARRDKKDAERRETEAKDAIYARLGRAKVAVLHGLRILRVDVRTRKGIDPAILREAFPEAYDRSMVETEYSVITVL